MRMNRILWLIKGVIVKTANPSLRRNPRLWVFGEWFGERCCDNSMFFANYLAKNVKDITLLWITKQPASTSSLNSRITVITMDSNEAKQALKKCGVVIVSQGLKDISSDEMNYTAGAVSVLLWHGIPWKKIGHDGSNQKNPFAILYRRIHDYSVGMDFYASPSDEYDTIARTAHGAKQNQMIHVGYPRNSLFYSDDLVVNARKHIEEELNKQVQGIDFASCKIVAYMPTFRKAGARKFSFDSLKTDDSFMSFLKSQNVVVVQKAHFVNQERDESDSVCSKKDRVFSLNNIMAQDLLCAADLLVTDYSGAFFDYLILDRPIVHFLYDYEYYKSNDRGLYYEKEDVVR